MSERRAKTSHFTTFRDLHSIEKVYTIAIMPVSNTLLTNRNQTGRAIYKHAEKFAGDLLPYGYHDLTLHEFYDLVRSIPYEENPVGYEFVVRPGFSLEDLNSPLDCKQKAVLIGAWLYANNIEWRLAAVSEQDDKEIHHVLVQANIKGSWKNIDATYPEFKLFEAKNKVTYAEELPR